MGQIKNFKVIEVDRENKKVALGLKQLETSPRELALNALELYQTYTGKVVKILPFGALVMLENQAVGLLHVSNATDKIGAKIYEVVKLDDIVEVQPINIDLDRVKVSFRLKKVIN